MKLENIAEEFDQCIKCGLCAATCPVCKELLIEKYSPRGKVQLARFYGRGDLELSDHFREIFARCLLCGACTVTCPSGVDLRKIFLAMRAEIAGARGVHPAMKAASASVLELHNISGEGNEERADWRDDLKAIPPHLYEREAAALVYFVGCVASFFPMAQRIPRNLVRILEAANVDFSILAGEEWCCGYPLISAGAPGGMEGLKAHNLSKVGTMGAKAVVFSCPTCRQTWRDHYETDLALYHTTQLIEKLVIEGALALKPVNATVTYHDPCDLGRAGGVFDAPRNILRSIPGLRLVEMESHGARSTCCGGGGNLEMADAGLCGAVAGRKVEEILRTGADTVVTACQQCVRTIQSQARRRKVPLEVLDITDMVARAL